MNTLVKISISLFLIVFIGGGCSRSEVTDDQDAEARSDPGDERSVEFSPDTPLAEPGEDTSPPGEDTPPPGEDTPPPGEGTSPPVTNGKGGRGLFYTPEELEIWNKRRLNGPYKDNWDNRIFANAQLFLKGERDAAPWQGYTGGGCWSPSTDVHPHDHRARGTWANSAGFVYRVLKYAGDSRATAYFNKVKTYLLAHTTIPGIDFKNEGKWCVSSYSIQGHQQWFGAWARRLAITYSWIKADMSQPDRNRFEAWLLGLGRYIVKHNEWHISKSFSNRYDNRYHCDRAFCPGQYLEKLYSGGPNHYQINDTWNNRAAVVASGAGIIGIICGDNVLRDKGVRWVRESLRYSVWPDGTYVDIIRTSPSNTNAWSYPMDYMGSIATLADALARRGDHSLYDYQTREGAPGGTESGGGQPAKSISLVIKHLAGQVDGKVKKGHPIITSKDARTGETNDSEWYFCLSNIYYKSNYINGIYNRTGPGVPKRTKISAAGWDRHTGDWSTFPDMEFMWAGLEGKVWPYGRASGRRSQPHVAPLCDSGKRDCSADIGVR